MFGSVSQSLKPLALSILGSNFVARSRLRALGRSEALTILNFHRVDDREGSAYEAMKPAVFEELVRWLKQQFSVVTFDELDMFGLCERPLAIISFDDGYKDFIEIVVPILEKHRLRVNQNLIPSVLETGLPPMNVQLQDFIGNAPATLLREVTFPGLPGGADPDNRVLSGLQASRALKIRPIEEQKATFAELWSDFERFDGFRATPVMSVEDARQIAGVHEIGAHSFEHATMTEETDDYLREDIRGCLDYFDARLGIRPTVYALPNGGARSAQTELIRGAGFEHVLLTGEDFSRRSNWLHNRFTIFGATTGEARFRALGGLRGLSGSRPTPRERAN